MSLWSSTWICSVHSWCYFFYNDLIDFTDCSTFLFVFLLVVLWFPPLIPSHAGFIARLSWYYDDVIWKNLKDELNRKQKMTIRIEESTWSVILTIPIVIIVTYLHWPLTPVTSAQQRGENSTNWQRKNGFQKQNAWKFSISISIRRVSLLSKSIAILIVVTVWSSHMHVFYWHKFRI